MNDQVPPQALGALGAVRVLCARSAGAGSTDVFPVAVVLMFPCAGSCPLL